MQTLANFLEINELHPLPAFIVMDATYNVVRYVSQVRPGWIKLISMFILIHYFHGFLSKHLLNKFPPTFF